MSKIYESLKYFTALFQIKNNHVKYILAVILYRLRRKSKFPETRINLKGSKFITRENSMDIAHLSNLYEKDTTNFLMNLNPKNFIDVGAHIGRFSIILANKGTNVLSIEPSRDNFDQLIKNIKLNNLEDKIKSINKGCSEKRGIHILYFVPQNEGLSSIEKKAKARKETIKVEKLDNICENLNLKENSIDVIKIDVEGFELNVLKGASNILKEGSPILIIEITDKNKEKKIKKFLKKLDFINKKILDSRNFVFAKN